jgi:hypothetical protein
MGRIGGGHRKVVSPARLHYRQTRQTLLFEPTLETHARLEEAFHNRYQARLGLAVNFARFSLAFAFHNATVRLAGTGQDRHQRFLEAFNQYYVGHTVTGLWMP